MKRQLIFRGDCQICRGISKTRCIFCGEKLPRKRDLTAMEQIRLDAIRDELKWLRWCFNKLKSHNMAGTGDHHTDMNVRREIGDWGELTSGTVLSAEKEVFTIRLESGLEIRVKSIHRTANVGQTVTVRFFGGVPRL